MKSIGVCIITHRAKDHLDFCLPPLLNSPLKPKVLVVNSSSCDGTVERAVEMGAEALVIPRKEFNHGLTREKARKAIGTDIVVMMTPDAYFESLSELEKLVKPLIENQAVCAYARQLPHKGAKFFESFAREYNYPEQGHIRSLQDLEKFGVYTYFFSNSCSAYLNASLNEIGGFQEVLLGEDTIACAKLLEKGHRVAYAADCKVRHSHSYTLKQEFKRHFDTGLARAEIKSLLKADDNKRGQAFAKKLLIQTIQERPALLPYAFCHLGAKWLGYKIGAASKEAPLWWKKRLTSQDFYWENFV